MTFSPGDDIMFMPGEIREDKPWRRGVFQGVTNAKEQIVLVQLNGDPFSACVYAKQIRPLTERERDMPSTTKEKPKAKDLRRQAKALGVDGWEDMSLDELIEAVAEAEAESSKKSKKSSSKKSGKASKKAAAEDEDDDEDDEDEDDDTDDDDDDEDDEDEAPAKSKKSSKKSSGKAAKKASAKKSTKKADKPAKGKKADKGKAKGKSSKKAPAKAEREVAENGNPYTEGTNLWHMAEALIKGGKVSTLVKGLRKKVDINPRSREYDEDSLNAELQRRLIICSQHLRNDFGFEMEKEGRGWDAVIRCYKED